MHILNIQTNLIEKKTNIRYIQKKDLASRVQDPNIKFESRKNEQSKYVEKESKMKFGKNLAADKYIARL